MENNGNGKYKLAFWVMTTITVVICGGIVGGVVANDRLREDGDKRLEEKIHENSLCIKELQSQIIDRLSRMESRQDIILKKIKLTEE